MVHWPFHSRLICSTRAEIDLVDVECILDIVFSHFNQNVFVSLQVHWVQCDGCELWFHLHCIGLKPEQVSEDEEFICKNCRPKTKASKLAQNLSTTIVFLNSDSVEKRRCNTRRSFLNSKLFPCRESKSKVRLSQLRPPQKRRLFEEKNKRNGGNKEPAYQNHDEYDEDENGK